MAGKTSDARIERYFGRVEAFQAEKKKALRGVILWIALVIIDCIGGVFVFYQDESIGYEPVF